jgi:hypothetical protein
MRKDPDHSRPALQFLVVLFTYSETKGLSLEELQRRLMPSE